jgi:hypothetical protein
MKMACRGFPAYGTSRHFSLFVVTHSAMGDGMRRKIKRNLVDATWQAKRAAEAMSEPPDRIMVSATPFRTAWEERE